ncbi:uncharacterized protein METZ01_LOCUS320780, partial [marine metagenome]
MHNVVDVDTASESIGRRQRVVVQSNDRSGSQAGFSAPGFQFRWPDKIFIAVGAAWQEVQYILSPNNREQPGL